MYYEWRESRYLILTKTRTKNNFNLEKIFIKHKNCVEWIPACMQRMQI